jgi:redox-sensing transcriptional repressor
VSGLVLHGRPGCHLCDDAREILERVGAPFSEVDITTDDELHRTMLERIPVVALDGEELFEFFVDEEALRARLQFEGMIPGDVLSRSNGLPDGDGPGDRLSLGVAARLSRYLQVLTQAKKMGKETISSQELSDYTHVNSTQIRRDLSGFGKFGKRGVGYNVDSLVSQIRKILRTAGQHNIALFGAGHLGRAIASSDIFADHGFRVVAIFDSDPEKIGTNVGTVVVRGTDDLPAVVEDEDIVVGVLAVPNSAAQELADLLVAAGVKIIFNYSEALLQVPPEVTVHTSSPAVDLLYALYFYLT